MEYKKMIFAIVDNQTNIVKNTIVLNDIFHWVPPSGYYTVDVTNLEAGVEWSYNPQTSEWTPPPVIGTPIDETPGSTPNVIE
jgi:hypothetical protein